MVVLREYNDGPPKMPNVVQTRLQNRQIHSHPKSDCGDRVKPCKINCLETAWWFWVSHIPSRKLDMNIEAGTSRWSAVISAWTVAASLDHRTQYMDGLPALLKGDKKEKEKRRSFTSIQMLHTQTHTDTDTHTQTHTHVITNTHTHRTHTHIPHTHTSRTHTSHTHWLLRAHHSHTTHSHTHITHITHTHHSHNTHSHTHITHTHTHSHTHWLLRGKRGTWCTAKGSDVRPGVPLAVAFAW